jgi:hypothetical protein
MNKESGDDLLMIESNDIFTYQIIKITSIGNVYKIIMKKRNAYRKYFY